MFERFTASARAVIEDARYESRRRGDRRIGTEHLLLALQHDPATSRAVGSDIDAAREAADALDRDPLAAIGLELGQFTPTGHDNSSKRVPLAAGAETVLQQALARAAAENARNITTRHILLALLDRHEPDPVATLLTTLQIDPRVVRERLTAAARAPTCGRERRNSVDGALAVTRWRCRAARRTFGGTDGLDGGRR